MMTIAVLAVPAQTLNVTLAGQICKIDVYQKTTGLYMDLHVLGQPVVLCMLCRDRIELVRHAYLGFIGSLVFCDTQGVSDPSYDGLGTRFVFSYLEASDL